MFSFCFYILAYFYSPFFRGSEKKMQNEQTEPAGETRTRTKVRGEVKFAYSKKVYIKKKKVQRTFFNNNI